MAAAASTTLWRMYGAKAGVPATVLTGLVAWQRIDERRHDLDDVIAGLVLGTVIAWNVTGGYEPRILGGRLTTGAHPGTGAPMIGLEWDL